MLRIIEKCTVSGGCEISIEQPSMGINIRYKLLGTYIREKQTRIYDYILSVVGAYVVRTSSLNDKLLSN